MQIYSEYSIKRVWEKNKPLKGSEKDIYLITKNIFPISVFSCQTFWPFSNKKTKETFKSHISHI